jgi:iron complex outermembrane recepter protein
MRYFLLVLVFMMGNHIFAQTVADSVIVLPAATVKGFESNKEVLKTPAAVALLLPIDLQRYDNTPLTTVLNTVSGVRMEERSPGSYRIAIRGSSLRSPFGVRNVKVYWNGIPLTDANGLTYFNQLDPNSIGQIEILKGPSASIYGGGLGGVIRLDSKTAPKGLSVGISSLVGSFNTQNASVNTSYGSRKSNWFLSFSKAKTDGYRVHSEMNRQTINLNANFFFTPTATLHVFSFFSKMNYETPGGLTLQQMTTNRRAARPKAGTLPGAEEQKAGIFQDIGFVGASYEAQLFRNWDLTASIFGSLAALQNPFISNYEIRDEASFGSRVVLGRKLKKINGTLKTGFEWQNTLSSYKNFDNLKGEVVNFKSSDEIISNQSAAFIQYDWQIIPDLQLSSGLSFNQQAIEFDRYLYGGSIGSLSSSLYDRRPVVPFSPRVSLLKTFDFPLSFYFSLSDGFSAPTSQEFFSTAQNAVNSRILQAETARSLELGSKWRSKSRRLEAEMAVYKMNVKDALVRKLDNKGNEYFENSGLIAQNGAEASLKYDILKDKPQQILSVKLSYTFNDYYYKQYTPQNSVYNQNRLPGTAKHTAYLRVDATHAKGWFGYIDANYLSNIALNDANTFFAPATVLSTGRVGFKSARGKVAYKVFIGADNLLNKSYSFGYDFNAFGARFYNPAPMRNYNGGLSVNIGL